MGVLLGKQHAAKPLYLAIACEELRVFGEFEEVLRKIKGLPRAGRRGLPGSGLSWRAVL